MPCPLKVFLSHKVTEQGTAAKEFVEEIMFVADKEKLEIFLSPDISAGTRWDATVHKQLKESDVLILLYLTPSSAFDWCLYESGFFAAAALEESNKKLICILPEGEKAPGPLESWQNIEVTSEGIIKLLKVLFSEKSCPVKPDLFSSENASRLNELVDKLLEALGPGEIIQPLSHRVWITLPKKDPKKDDRDVIDELLAGKFPTGTTIRGETDAFRQFGIDSDQEIPYVDLLGRLEYKAALPFFTPILTKAVADILQRKTGPFSLPPIRVMNSGPARSLVFTYLTQKPNGRKIFEFVVHEPPPTAGYGREDRFSILFKLLAVALHFRNKVITQYDARLKNMIYDDDKTEEFRTASRDFLREMSFDIDAVILDTMNRGILSRGQLITAFEEGSEDLSKLTEIISIENGRWTAADQAFRTAVDSGNLVAAKKAFDGMKDLNRAIIAIASNRLSKLVEQRP